MLTSCAQFANVPESETPFFRDQFPAIIGNPGTIYFDNASTTQIHENVLTALQHYYTTHAANPGRGAYDWAESSDQLVNETRRKIAATAGMPDFDGVIFTSGATQALNMVAQGWGQHMLAPGDEVLLCDADHHSMVMPWLKLAERMGLHLSWYSLHADGRINLSSIDNAVSTRTKLCCVTHINNTAGAINDLAAIRDRLPDNVYLNVDAAQSFAHHRIDMAANGIDFLSFSAHKMFALTGAGALCVSPRAQARMKPVHYGGGMAEAGEGDPCYAFMEAGSPDMAGIVALSAALEIDHEAMRIHTGDLTHHLYSRLLSNPRLDLVYEQKPYALDHLSAIASFSLEGRDSGEVGDYLADHGIFVRTGRHCTGGGDSVRISLQCYNTFDEIDHVMDVLNTLTNDYI